MHRNPAEVCASPKPGRKRRVLRQEGHPACKKKMPNTTYEPHFGGCTARLEQAPHLPSDAQAEQGLGT